MLFGAALGQAAEGERNVVLFVGDGMGVSTVTAARILAGQLAGGTGEDHSLSFERFPHLALVKTYSLDLQVPESAATMTAIITGEKTRGGVLSVSGEVERGDCATALGLSPAQRSAVADGPDAKADLPPDAAPASARRPNAGAVPQPKNLETLLERAERAGFATGVVTTTNLTHATPAAAYAHSADRAWENDALMPEEAAAAGCRDIARQLVEFDIGDGMDVMLGGGRAHFFGADRQDPEYPDQSGQRTDGRDLVAEWLRGGEGRAYAWRLDQLAALDGGAKQVLGLFEPSHMQFEADRSQADEPSLAAMTEFAIRRLQRGGRGFLLIVEGGRIDHAHHFGNAYRALTDVLALDAAVARAEAMTDPDNTLILVTADHSHTLTLAGYPRRGNPILGKVETAPGQMATDQLGRPYTTLGYVNGPGWREQLPDLTEVDTEAPNYMQAAAYPLEVETHGGEDVAAYAKGLNAEALDGVIEQNLLHDLMFQALFGRLPPRSPP